MYQKPTLERFGTLRELTLLGLGSAALCGYYSPCPESEQEPTNGGLYS